MRPRQNNPSHRPVTLTLRVFREAVHTPDTLDRSDASDRVVVVVPSAAARGDVVPQGGEVAGRDGFHAELLHRGHLDEELVDQDPQEDEEDPPDLSKKRLL